MFSLRLSLLRLGGKTYGGCLPDASQMPPRCLSDASQMPLRCLSDASQMPLRCFFSKWFLLYDSLFNDSSSRISSLSSLLQRAPPPWFLLIDFSSMIFRMGLQRNSVWGLALGSCMSFYFILRDSPNRFICRGSNGVGKGALMCHALRWRLPASSNVAIYTTWWSDPQKHYIKATF